MTKTKNKKLYLPLVVTGYTLFSLLVIATLISTTVPLGILLFSPKVMHLNVAVLLVAFTIGSLLPVFLGYIIGDHSVKSKSKLSHHFTGMLFGLLSYWLVIQLSVYLAIPFDFSQENRNVGLMIVNLIPSIGVALIASALAIAHVRSRYAKQEILTYKPYSILLIMSLVALPVWSLIQNIITNSVGIYSFVPLIIVAVSGAISYATLRNVKLKKYNKVVWSAVSVSVLFVAMFVVSQFVSAISNYIFRTPTMETQTFVTWFGFALALTGWAVYWFKQVKALR